MSDNRILFFASIITVIISALSPYFTAYLQRKTNRDTLDYQLKIHNAGFYTQHRAEAIERYISAAGAAIKANGQDNTAQLFGASASEIYLYVPSSLWPALDEIYSSITKRGCADCSDKLIDVCKALASLDEQVRHKSD